MDERTRNIIQAVCHEQSEAWKIDYVQGKGEGQTVLLHGILARALPAFLFTHSVRTSRSWQNLYRWSVNAHWEQSFMY